MKHLTKEELIEQLKALANDETDIPVGCGIAGYVPEDIAPMFRDAAELENVYLPVSFWKVLMGIDKA